MPSRLSSSTGVRRRAPRLPSSACQRACGPSASPLRRTSAGALKTTPPHVLICCAGVATLPQRTVSKDGYELQFAVNHLAHFALVCLLRTALPEAARVVVVSSDLHSVGASMLQLNMDNLNSETSYSFLGAYLASKYCNVLFARELAARHNICVVSCSSGSTTTDIDCHLPAPVRFVFRYLGPRLLAKTPAQGAATIAFCAAAPVQAGSF